MNIHEVANLFPLLEGEEYRQLVEDIRENGLREPITTWKGDIVDGRNRYRACQDAGVEPRYVKWDGKGSLVAFVLSKNLMRRHLTPSQRSMVAQNVLPLLEAEAKERQRKHGGTAPGKTVSPRLGEVSGKATEQAAKLVGVSRGYVEDAKRIKAADPELAEQVLAGKVSLPQAKRAIQKERPGFMERGDLGDQEGPDPHYCICAACGNRHWKHS